MIRNASIIGLALFLSGCITVNTGSTPQVEVEVITKTCPPRKITHSCHSWTRGKYPEHLGKMCIKAHQKDGASAGFLCDKEAMDTYEQLKMREFCLEGIIEAGWAAHDACAIQHQK